MSNKHTTGPWSVNDGNDVWIGNRICIYVGDENDARLIAAAPDLLEALSAFIGMIDCGNENPQEIVNQGRSAIAKATGEDK